MVDVLDIINEVFNGVLGEVPCYNTIDNWVKKCGLDIYNNAGTAISNKPYAEIVDESMMVGSNKLLLTLGVPADHMGRPLKHEDVSVLDMCVDRSFNGELVRERLDAATQTIGYDPKYVISDNASIMNKGIRLTGFEHHRDITHSLGMFLERTYKDEADFKDFTKQMSDVQCKHNMKAIAYLLPPTQRTIARFINLTNWVSWADRMLEAYHRLSEQEREVFAFVPSNASLIKELAEVMSCINFIENECKQRGLSKTTVCKCEKQIKTVMMKGNSRMRELSVVISQFLSEEVSCLKSDNESRNNSSDIIESTFGVFKAKKSPNKLYGVTSFVLFIPAYAKLADSKSAKKHNFKEHLENLRVSQIKEWTDMHLTKNLVVKRIQTLKNAI